jgi:hypothetical protein
MPACCGMGGIAGQLTKVWRVDRVPLSNAPFRANVANGVTGYDQATLLRKWAIGLALTSNRDNGPCRPHPLGTSRHPLGT